MYEGFLIRGWEPILTGVFWLYVRSPANQRSASSGRHFTPCFAVFYHGDHRFCPQVVKVVEVSNELGSGNETISSPGAMGPPRRVRWDCDVVPRGTLAASWPDMSKLVSNQSVGSIFSHRVGFDGVVEISTEFSFGNG